MNITALFPTPIGSVNFHRDLTDGELAFVHGQEKKVNQGNMTSTNTDVLSHPELAELSEFITKSVDEYFEEMFRPKFDVKLRITQSWFNYSDPGQFHHKHSHSGSLVSGCFYPQADIDVDRIYFYQEGQETLPIEARDFNIYNSKSWWLSVGTGMLLLFPSSLVHMVQTVETPQTRISLAFNTFPVGQLGNPDTLTGLRV